MKKKTMILYSSVLLVITLVFSLNSLAFDFCKGNPSKNNGTCEQQCSSQVECVSPATGSKDCYGHGMDEPSLPTN